MKYILFMSGWNLVRALNSKCLIYSIAANPSSWELIKAGVAKFLATRSISRLTGQVATKCKRDLNSNVFQH